MARKKAVRRENGRGTVEKTSSKNREPLMILPIQLRHLQIYMKLGRNIISPH